MSDEIKKENPDKQADVNSDDKDMKDDVPPKADNDSVNKKTAFSVNLQNHLNDIPDYGATSKKEKSKRTKLIKKLIIICAILLVSIFLAISIIFVSKDISGIGKENKTVIMEVEKGWGVSQIADQLEQNGTISSAFLFKSYYKIAHLTGDFKVGTYTLNCNMSYSAIVKALSEYSNNQNNVSIMFKEGSTIFDMAELLEKNKVCTGTDFLNIIKTVDFNLEFESDIKDNSKRIYKYEGFLFPDTYNFTENQDPKDVVATMLNNTSKKLTPELRKKIKSTGYSLDEFITLASIVQAEGTTDESMKNIASVYYNRLKNAGEYPKLQADPTTNYAEKMQKYMEIVDTKITDSYDTYKCNGLPSGPICNPGINAINDTVEPAKTNFYYFCSSVDSKNFYYAATYSEHQKNLIKAGLR